MWGKSGVLLVITKGLSCYLRLRKASKESAPLQKDDFPKPVSLKSTCPALPPFAFPLPRLAQQWQIYAITRICSVIRGPAWQRPGFAGYLSCFSEFWSCLCVCFLSSSSSKAVQRRPLREKQTGMMEPNRIMPGKNRWPTVSPLSPCSPNYH